MRFPHSGSPVGWAIVHLTPEAAKQLRPMRNEDPHHNQHSQTQYWKEDRRAGRIRGEVAVTEQWVWVSTSDGERGGPGSDYVAHLRRDHLIPRENVLFIEADTRVWYSGDSSDGELVNANNMERAEKNDAAHDRAFTTFAADYAAPNNDAGERE